MKLEISFDMVFCLPLFAIRLKIYISMPFQNSGISQSQLIIQEDSLIKSET